MKKLLTATALLLTVLTVQAQKCKFNIDEIDQFTRKEVKGNVVGLPRGWRLSLIKSNNEYKVSLLVSLRGEINNKVQKGDSMFIAFEDKMPLKLIATTEITPESVITGNSQGVITYFKIDYYCSKDNLIELSEHNTTAIKVFVGETSYSINLGKGDSKKLMHNATCIASL